MVAGFVASWAQAVGAPTEKTRASQRAEAMEPWDGIRVIGRKTLADLP